MIRSRMRSLVFSTIPLLTLGAGCGDGKPSVSTSTEEATVKGTVTVQGKPVKGGEVVFDPSNYQRKMASIRVAPVGQDGTYRVTTLVGENQVEYKAPRQSYPGRMLTVASGEQTIDLELAPTARPR